MILDAKKILQSSRFISVGIILYLTSTLGTCYMLFPFMPLLFVNRRLFHSVSDRMLSLWLGLAVFLLEHVCQLRIVFHRSKKNVASREKLNSGGLIIMNHRTRMDWLFYFCILYRLNQLTSIKIILKDVLKKIPGPGWAMQTGLFIFLKRRWEVDQKIFKKFINYFERVNKTVNILIFPEGTDYCKHTLERSDTYARDNNLPKYIQVLHPRTTGFVHIFNMLRSRQMLARIDDVTVGYRSGKIPESELDFALGNLAREIHFYFDSFDSDKLIDGNNNNQGIEDDGQEANARCLETWLKDRWRIKEDMLSKFYDQEESGKQEFNERYQSLYDTDPSVSSFIYIYPIYWTLSTLLVIYMAYHYFLFKIYLSLAFMFYFVFIQLMNKELDHAIIDSDKSQISSSSQVKKED